MVRLFLPDAHRFVVAVVTHRGHEAEFVERLDRYIPPRKLLLKKGELKGREGICGHSSVKVSGVKVSGIRFRCEYFVFHCECTHSSIFPLHWNIFMHSFRIKIEPR